MAEKKTARELIEQGLRDTERLISRKEYNHAMIKARQTLEYIVRSLARRSGIAEGDLMNMIDDLYRKGVISRDSCAHYHKIRMLGSNALRENDNNAYNANNAYQLLSQEVYAYQGRSAKKDRQAAAAQSQRRAASQQSSARRQAYEEPYEERRSSGHGFEPFDLLKILIPILAVILIVFIVRLFRSDSKPQPTKAPETTTEAVIETTVPEETEAPAETEPAGPRTIYKTTSKVNVRTQPNTNGDIIVTLEEGAEIEYAGAYNNSWAVVTYEGQQAYIASQYIASEVVGE